MSPAPPLASLRAARVTFGGAPLFDGVTLSVGRGDRACLVGRNGSGKSTLLKALAGEVELDGGERFLQPGARLAYLPQNPIFELSETVAEYVARGLPAADAGAHYRVDAVLGRLGLDGARALGTLSGGEGRRAALARALVCEPDLLLLDEPTNHLDLPTIEWLEGELQGFAGGLLLISHDRALLRRVARRVLWLDRGEIRELNDGFARFEEWSDAILAAEEEAAHRLDRKIAAETHWLNRGVTARRKRNEGRLRRLQALRRQRAERVKAAGRAGLALGAAETGGQLVIEAQGIGKRFPAPTGEKVVLRGLSTRILRGERVGIIGPNGAGKTTLLKLLTGEMQPDEGTVHLGTNLRPIYLDQQRATLDAQATLWKTLAPGGGDSIMVRGQQRHVVAYLRDFLFDERQALMPVSSLSGGERARLLLAKLFAAPGNLVVLDEPTNDLDMETLDLLQEVLDDYEGTLLLVSHDRDFLDRLVTSVIAMEGDGTATEYPGGYSDYRRQRPAAAAKPAETKPPAKPSAKPSAKAARPAEAAKPGARLSYNEQRELNRLPARIEALMQEIAELEAALADASFYARDPAAFDRAARRLEAANAELSAAETRWLALEERREALARSDG